MLFGVTLTGVGGNEIQTYGQCHVSIGIKGLRRQFPVTFIAADVKPILGADFLTQHGLMLNMKSKSLHDPHTSLTANLIVSQGEMHSIHASETKSDSYLSRSFPKLIEPPDYTQLPNTSVSHAIETTGVPLYCKPRPLSAQKLEVARQEFNQLLSLKIVQPSSSPWASPLHMVRKPNGSWRPCGDYRRINKITTPIRYPLHNIEHFHQRLQNSTIFSKLDLVNAYHFIPMDLKDVAKTAIYTPFGSFEYLRMPFGLRNSSGTFQRFIDTQLRDFPFTSAYLDDILIASSSHEQHEKHLRLVLSKLEDIGLRVNEDKCKFFNMK